MQHKVLPPCSPHRVGTRIREGCLFFEKRHPSLTPSQRKFFIASEQLEELQCLPIAPLACGKAAFTPAIRLGVLLSSAAALPISRWYSLISVYRSTHQCGERSNAAFRTQSAARQTSLAHHGSKARLQTETTRRRFMAKPCTPRPIAQRVQFFKIKTANVRGQGGRPLVLSLGGARGIFSFEKENIPLIRVPHTVWGKPRSAFALPFYPAREKIRKGHLSPFSFFVHCYNGLPLREVCHGHLHRKRLRV